MLGFESKQSSHRYLSYADGMAALWQDWLLLVSRVLIGWIYLQSGAGKILHPAEIAAGLTKRGVPDILAFMAPFVEFFGGLALVLGFATRYAALLLILFTIIATWIAHTFWSFPEGAQRSQQFTNFWKNVTMTGGILALFVAGPGRFSLDRWLSKR